MERQSTGFGGYTGKTYTRKNFYLEYIKNSQNSRVRIKTWTKRFEQNLHYRGYTDGK